MGTALQSVRDPRCTNLEVFKKKMQPPWGGEYVRRQVRRNGGDMKRPFLGTWLDMHSEKDVLHARPGTTEAP